ncbi:glycosyltransferase family 4 protein [Ferviditalea candida]|uniref:Glycosyltransferase family 4 protein n=1 Tax=Ferviditalea candida TaxID=3108399 RepID=A0ABU5ZE52_9BACL|nr:glycosyltransferase family 4 protein [Paenibacillaceae bacterium T2]
MISRDANGLAEVPKKVLFAATVDFHFAKFHLPYLKWFKERGWEVHVAANGELELPYVDKKHNLPIQRSPFKLQNAKAYSQLRSIIDSNAYGIIHCHTPMGGALARWAARAARRRGTKVLYTAHGFHFYNGSPLFNWLVYYPVEKALARYTDCLITINEEDYNLAVRYRFKAGRIEHVHGVGVNDQLFKPAQEAQKQELRTKFGYRPDEFLMFYAAEFNPNKNQQMLIQALALIQHQAPRIKLLLAGSGLLAAHCKALAAELGVENMVDFLGYRNDIKELLQMCDVAVASSYREGLPVNILEAMGCGLPIIASLNRGHRELVKDGVNGYLVSNGDSRQFADRMQQLSQSRALCKQMGDESLRRVKPFSLSQAGAELGRIYSHYVMEERDETESQYYSAYI